MPYTTMNKDIEETIEVSGRTIKFSMTKHCTDPEIEVLHRIGEWIMDNYNFKLTNGPWFAILDVILGIKIARIDSKHPLWKYLDSSSQSDENCGITKNYLIWEGKIGDKKPILVTHFGPFGKMKRRHFEKIFNKMEEVFLDGLKKIGADTLEGLQNMEDGKVKNHSEKTRQYLDHVRPSLQQRVADSNKNRKLLEKETGTNILLDVAKVGFKYGLSNVAVKDITKFAAKTATRTTTKNIPAAGVLAGGLLGVHRLYNGDVTGSCLELASGVFGQLPGGGTAASFGLDAILAGRDIKALMDQKLQDQINEQTKHIKVIEDALTKTQSHCYEDVFNAVEFFTCAPLPQMAKIDFRQGDSALFTLEKF